MKIYSFNVKNQVVKVLAHNKIEAIKLAQKVLSTINKNTLCQSEKISLVTF